MESIRRQNPQAALMSLEAAAASARGGFACLFSTADEYETALIAERRAQGRYTQSRSYWPSRCSAVAPGRGGTVMLFA